MSRGDFSDGKEETECFRQGVYSTHTYVQMTKGTVFRILVLKAKQCMINLVCML